MYDHRLMLVTKLEKVNPLDLNYNKVFFKVLSLIQVSGIKRAPKKGLGLMVRTVSKRLVRSSMFTAILTLFYVSDHR